MQKRDRFKTKHKFKCIPKHERLRWLRRSIAKALNERVTSVEAVRTYHNMRRQFNAIGPVLSEQAVCYVCCLNKATIRHHIKPLILGGRNKYNNIVPLCGPCHAEVHKVGPRRPLPVKTAIPDDDAGVLRIKKLLKEMYPVTFSCP